MHFSRLASTVALAGTAAAWLPQEVMEGKRLHARDLPGKGKVIRGLDGVNLFEARQQQQYHHHTYGPPPYPPSYPHPSSASSAPSAYQPTGSASGSASASASVSATASALTSATTSGSSSGSGSSATPINSPGATPTPGSGGNSTGGSGGAPKPGIRGVNLGSLFVFEPWIAEGQWSELGCNNAQSEVDCGNQLGQSTANTAFQKHWAEWYTEQDFVQMKQYGLNTVRIPTGFWMDESLPDRSTEKFAQGGLAALKKVCGWAADQGIYVIIDQHGAPGAQVPNNPDTGYNAAAQFFQDSNYERSLQYLEFIAGEIHNDTTGSFRTVGMLEILNEPEQGASGDQDMISNFYPNAQKRIRAVEASLNVPAADQLTLFYMNTKWGAGDPTTSLETTQGTAYDDHRYIKWANTAQSPQAYAQATCSDDRGGMPGPTIVGEWSLSAPLDSSQQNSSTWDPSQNKEWYQGWFAAQANVYAKQYGWIFWTWKTQLWDVRWDYSLAVQQGYIPADLSGLQATGDAFCSKYGSGS